MERDQKRPKHRTYTDAEIELMLMAKFLGIEPGEERPDFNILWENVLTACIKKCVRLAKEIRRDDFIQLLDNMEPGIKDDIHKMQQSVYEIMGVPKDMLK